MHVCVDEGRRRGNEARPGFAENATLLAITHCDWDRGRSLECDV